MKKFIKLLVFIIVFIVFLLPLWLLFGFAVLLTSGDSTESIFKTIFNKINNIIKSFFEKWNN